MVNSDNNWYKVIVYVHNKMIYSHMYTSTYDLRVQILLPQHVLVYIRVEKDNMMLLPYVSTFYTTFVI